MRRRSLLSAVRHLPDGYTPLSFIATGAKQYIDTGVIAKSGLTSYMKIAFGSIPLDATILGARRSGARYYLAHYYNGFTLGYGNYYTSSAKAQTGVDYIINTMLRAGAQNMVVNDAAVISNTISNEIDTGLNLYLFCSNYDGRADYFTTAKCYYCKIFDNGVMIRDFVPCINPEGVYGMYDFVEGLFYASRSGAFVGA